jgi:N-acyl-L-amino-acid amidohydrolase
VGVIILCHIQKIEKTPFSIEGGLQEPIITFLQKYIAIDTSHPNPRYDDAIQFLKKHAQADGFPYQEVALPSGKKVFVITYQGSDPTLKSIVLNHHMDVVPVTNDAEWVKPPFAGEIYQGAIIGRGTQDMKGIGATHYFALKALKEQGIIPRRTIHLFAVPEEEVGGFKGTKEFVETTEFTKLNVGYVVDEGHASGIDNIVDIKVAERKPIQIQVTSKGTLSHGSHLLCQNAIHDLIKFLNKTVACHEEQQQQCCHHTQPGELVSYNITSLTAGVRKKNNDAILNMVPDCAQATVDVRVPCSIKKAKIITKLDELMQEYPTLSYIILAQADEEPDIQKYETELYKGLRSSIEKFGLLVQPHFFEASSDLRFYQARGIQGVGLTPFTIQDNIHGTNESVPIEQLVRGQKITLQFLKDFCL